MERFQIDATLSPAEISPEGTGTARNDIYRTYLFICALLTLNVAFGLFVLSTSGGLAGGRAAYTYTHVRTYFSIGRCPHQLRQYFDRPGSNGSRGEIYAGLINSPSFIIYAPHTRRTINFQRPWCARERHPVTITRPHEPNCLNRSRARTPGPGCPSTRSTSNRTIARRTVHTKKCECRSVI